MKSTERPLPADAGAHDKQAEKRRELAAHTLAALAELGFARINLREVAARSGASLGSIHYYFDDKTDLLIHSMRLYKEAFVRKLEQVIDSATDLGDLAQRFPEALAGAIESDGSTHRLWYDLRAQALFEPAFQPAVAEIENRLVAVAGRFLEKARSLGAADVPPDALDFYLLLDGWFRYGLQQHLAGEGDACMRLRQRLARLAPVG